jgi:hypothetical protein
MESAVGGCEENLASGMELSNGTGTGWRLLKAWSKTFDEFQATNVAWIFRKTVAAGILTP